MNSRSNEVPSPLSSDPFGNVLLLLLHGLSAMLLLGAVTHQVLALWSPAQKEPADFWRALRAVHPERYTRSVVILYCLTVLFGAANYLRFRVLVRAAYLDAHVPWATGLFEVKEHAATIGLALLPAYWIAWRDPTAGQAQKALTTILTVVVWWSFLVGHIVNNIRGL
jgi:hypothetical protein